MVVHGADSAMPLAAPLSPSCDPSHLARSTGEPERLLLHSRARVLTPGPGHGTLQFDQGPTCKRYVSHGACRHGTAGVAMACKAEQKDGATTSRRRLTHCSVVARTPSPQLTLQLPVGVATYEYWAWGWDGGSATVARGNSDTNVTIVDRVSASRMVGGLVEVRRRKGLLRRGILAVGVCYPYALQHKVSIGSAENRDTIRYIHTLVPILLTSLLVF